MEITRRSDGNGDCHRRCRISVTHLYLHGPGQDVRQYVERAVHLLRPRHERVQQNPTGWQTPAGPTNGNFAPPPLTQTYAGANFTEWNSVVGSSFFLGFDVNDTSTAQILSTMTVEFFNASNALLSEYDVTPTATPSTGEWDWLG